LPDLKTFVVVEPLSFRALQPGGEVRSVGLRGHVLPPRVSLEVCQSEVEDIGQSGHVRGAGIPVHARGEASGVVHREQDLPVTHILGSKGKDRSEYSQKLKSVNVLTSYRVGDYVGVEGPRDARDAAPRLNQPGRAYIAGKPAVT
jgi:hypothetical protein